MKINIKHEIFTTLLLAVYVISNWLMDVFENFKKSTNGFFNGFFNLNMSQSFHLTWYISISLFLVLIVYSHWQNAKIRKYEVE